MILNLQGNWDYADPVTGLFSKDRFWEEKVSWAENGDRTPDGQIVIRIDGEHYVASPGVEKRTGFVGHGGRVLQWIDFDSNTVHESNDVWHQGTIPEHFRDLLPDNAEWAGRS